MEKDERQLIETSISESLVQLKGQRLEKLIVWLDIGTDFSFLNIPFMFMYSHFVTIHTDKERYLLGTTELSTGPARCSLWLEKDEENDRSTDRRAVYSVDVNQTIDHIQVFKGVDNHYYKLTLKTKSEEWAFVAADIYEDGDIRYRLNDEMLLTFNDFKELQTFEKIKPAHNNA